MLDCESLERTYSLSPDPRDILGATQRDWLLNDTTGILLSEPVKVNLLVAQKAWIGDTQARECPPTTGFNKNRDKLWMYNAWREMFRDWLGEHDVNVVWLGGDRHNIAWDSGVNNAYGGFPCMIGSGWNEHSNELVAGESYGAIYPGLTGGSAINVMQYIRGTIIDDGGDVTMTTELRYLSPTTGFITSLPTSIPLTLNWP